MRAKKLRQFELLESRYALSGTAVVPHFLASDAIASTSSAPMSSAPVTPESVVVGPTAKLSESYFLASTPSAPVGPTTNRWDWLANTVWYVPTSNLLAYATLPDLTHAQAVGDQTVWHITSSSNGQFAGTGSVVLSVDPSSSSGLTFTGFVTDGGQVQINFTSDSSQTVTTGVGQMRFVNGAWAVEMQMTTAAPC